MKFDDIALCACGAISVTIDGQTYSMTKETYVRHFGEPPEEFDFNYCNCNHCVNHWGIDLCACGSGETPEECQEGFEMCGTPLQSIDGGVVKPSGGWL